MEPITRSVPQGGFLMRRLLPGLMILGLAFPLISAAAQQPDRNPPTQQWGQRRGPGMSPEAQAARLKDRLKLTDEQTEKVKALLQKLQQERATWLQNNPQATPEERRAEMQKLMKERNDGLKEILTPDQWKQYQQEMEQMRMRMRERREPRP
jgi:Spy/CpxP family protein refolding chaperone